VITLEIDGHEVTVEDGTTILEAVRAHGGEIPTLCFDDRQAPFGACRVCLVGVEGAPGPVASCTTIGLYCPSWYPPRGVIDRKIDMLKSNGSRPYEYASEPWSSGFSISVVVDAATEWNPVMSDCAAVMMTACPQLPGVI